MKLKNKNTGEIGEGHIYFTAEGKIEVSYMADSNTNSHCVVTISYDSIAELSENFEIVKKTEPLIKDEKVRKAVRAWAEANEIGSQDTIRFDAIEHRLIWVSTAIEFNEFKAISDLEKIDYNIAELCGEEE